MEKNKQKCTQCGAEIKESDDFCGECGMKIEEKTEEKFPQKIMDDDIISSLGNIVLTKDYVNYKNKNISEYIFLKDIASMTYLCESKKIFFILFIISLVLGLLGTILGLLGFIILYDDLILIALPLVFMIIFPIIFFIMYTRSIYQVIVISANNSQKIIQKSIDETMARQFIKAVITQKKQS